VALLCLHLSVRLNVDVLVGREGGDHVVGDLGAGVCQYYCGEVQMPDCVPEALDQSELVGDLAALVGDVLLCLVELLLGSGVLEGDLGFVSMVQTTVCLGGLTMKAGMLRVGSLLV